MSDQKGSIYLREFKFAMPRASFFIVFAISGFSGLIYESIWSHYLKLFLGHAAYAQSLVLIIFMGGMAAGAWLASKLSARWKSLLLAYAAVEVVIGLAALFFHPVFKSLIDGFYASVLPGVGSPFLGNTLKFLSAGLLILPQSILLGMTFPLMSAGIIRRYPETPGGSIAMLYFTNSIGAAVGVLASGFWMIDRFGLPGTIFTAGFLNIALAITVYVLVRLDNRVPQIPPPPTLGNSELTLLARRFLFAAFITGAASFIYEIGWIRMLSLVLGSTTHSFELMLSAFITGLAFGGLWIKRRVDSIDAPVRFSGYVQLIMGTLAILTLPVYAQTFGWMEWLIAALDANEKSYAAFSFASHAIALAVMLPTTFMAGMTLPLFTYVLLKRGDGERSIGRVYAANTVGAIVGVLFAVHIGLPLLGLKNLIIFGALLDIGLGIYLLNCSENAQTIKRHMAKGALVSGAVLVLVFSTVHFDERLLASGVYRMGTTETLAGSDMRYYRDGKTASISLSRQPNGWLSISTNGKSDAAIQADEGEPYAPDEITMTLLGSLAVAYKPDVTTAAVVGMGSGMTTHTLLAKDQIERVDTVEIEAAIVEASKGFGEYVERAHNDPRSHIHIEDAKTYFSLHNSVYDIITAEPSNPWVSGVASLFSTEFYGTVRNYLADDGLFMQWIQLYEFNDDLAISILRAMSDNFDDFVIYSADDGNILLIAKNKGQLGEPDWNAVFGSGLTDSLARIDIHSEQDLLVRRLLSKKNLETYLELQFMTPANSDYYPYVDLNAGKARFALSQAEMFGHWMSAPLPVLEMLNGDRLDFDRMVHSPYLQRYDRIKVASWIQRRLVDGESSLELEGEGLTVPSEVSYLVDWLVLTEQACADDADVDQWLAAVHQVMSTSLANLSQEMAADLVNTIGGTDCEALQRPKVAAWLDLYWAIANRDADGMSSTAVRLLQSGTAPEETGIYLLSAAMLGDIAAGEPVRAHETWEQFGSGKLTSSQFPEDLRLLLAIAFGAARNP